MARMYGGSRGYTMEDAIQDLLVDLKIVGMVEPNEELYMNDGMLALKSISEWQPLWLHITNSNIGDIIKRIKQRIVLLEHLLREGKIKERWIKNEITALIKPVVQGITNLQKRYERDCKIQATFGLIIERVENISTSYLQPPP